MIPDRLALSDRKIGYAKYGIHRPSTSIPSSGALFITSTVPHCALDSQYQPSYASQKISESYGIAIVTIAALCSRMKLCMGGKMKRERCYCKGVRNKLACKKPLVQPTRGNAHCSSLSLACKVGFSLCSVRSHACDSGTIP